MRRAWLALFFFALLFVVGKAVAHAGDCSDPSDCEQTAGYNAVVAVAGGLIALGAGLVGGSLAGAEEAGGAEEVVLAGVSATQPGGQVVSPPQPPAAQASAPAPGVEDRVYDGQEALEILERMGMATRLVRPDGTVGYRPNPGFFDLQAQHTIQWVISQTRDRHGNLIAEDTMAIDSVEGVAYDLQPDGTIERVAIVARQGAQPPLQPLHDVPAPPTQGAQLSPTAPSVQLPIFGQERNTSCGPACARMVYKTLTGSDAPEANIRELTCTRWDPVNGTAIRGVRDALREYDVKVNYITNPTVDNLAAAADPSHPTIVLLHPEVHSPGALNHFVVVDQVRTNTDGTRTLIIRDPWPPNAGRKREMSEAEYNHRIIGWPIRTN